MRYLNIVKCRAIILMVMLVILFFQSGVCLKNGGVYAQEKEEISIVIDGAKLNFSRGDGMGVPYIDSSGRTQVPIRKALEKIGATVSFATDTGSGEKIIIISKDGSVIRLTADSPIMRVNGDIIFQLDTIPQIMEGRTYMPLRAVLEVLGYSVSWDGELKTVKIQKNQDMPLPSSAISGSAVTPAGRFDLPRDRYKGEEKPEVIVNHGYIYYRGENNTIMQTTFSDLTKSRKVYDCPAGIMNLFNDENGVPRLYYRTEGEAMGSPHQFALNTDGSMTELNGGREYAVEIYSTEGQTFAFRDLKGGKDSRLEMKNEAGAYVNLGGRENRYDYNSELNGFNGRRGVYLIGDNLYLMAEPFSGNAGAAVYRVNIKTDEAARITDKVYGFQIEGKYLYYNLGKEIRKRNLEDGTESSIYNFYSSATDYANDFAILNGNLYIIGRWSIFYGAVGEEKRDLSWGNYIISCNDMALRGDKGDQYLICSIGKSNENGTGGQWMWVYDKDGKLIMEKEGDIRLNSVSVEEGKICYYNNTTNQINVEKIK